MMLITALLVLALSVQPAAGQDLSSVYGIRAGEVIAVTATPATEDATDQTANYSVGADAGGFDVLFDDVDQRTGVGFDDPQLGEQRRAVALAAVAAISELLSNEPGRAILRFQASLMDAGNPNLALGTALFQCLEGFQKPLTYHALHLGQRLFEVDGMMQINFGHPFNNSLAPATAAEHDLYSILMHEFGHVLGLTGFPVGTAGQPVDCGDVSSLPETARWLRNIDGQPLWTSDGGAVVFNGVPARDLAAASLNHLALPGLTDVQTRIRTGVNQLEGHWHPGVSVAGNQPLMGLTSFPLGLNRRELSYQSKLFLQQAIGYEMTFKPGGVTGTWFDPALAGQGFNIQVIDSQRLLIYYYGYTADGQRLWLIGDYMGSVTANTPLQITMLEATGTNFGNFDPDAVQISTWGTATLTILDCNQATISLNGGDGSQSLNLQKLADVTGLDCL